jgi:hypothetical protein
MGGSAVTAKIGDPALYAPAAIKMRGVLSSAQQKNNSAALAGRPSRENFSARISAIVTKVSHSCIDVPRLNE